MKRTLFLIAALASLTLFASAQSKTNDAISKQIKDANIGKTFALTYDANSNVTKLMAVSDNFSDSDAGKIGALAMNFAVGFMYSGQAVTKAPDKVIFTFWVLTKKPRFTANHRFIAGDVDLGTARYVSKPRESMEYLNYDISWEDLTKMAASPNAVLKLGDFEINFSRAQIKNLSDLLKLSDPSK